MNHDNAALYLGNTGPDVQRELRKALEFIGWTQRVPRNALVAVKPNLCWPEPLPGVTTSPAVIEALLAALKERTSRIVLVESNGGNFRAEEAFRRHGLDAVCDAHGARFVNLSRGASTPVQGHVAGKRVALEYSTLLLDQAEVFITVPVLKTHVVTRVSLGLKNQWGCIPSSMRLLYHHELDRGIVAINRARPPDICIIDATYGLDGRGPVFGEAVPLGKLVVSNSVVAADSFGSRMLGLDPGAVRHVRFAAQEGLGPRDLDQVRLSEPVPAPPHVFSIRPAFMDVAAIVSYKSRLLSRLVYASSLTRPLFRLLRRTPPGVEERGAPITDLATN